VTVLPFQNQAGNLYQPQQAEVVVQMARAVQDGQLTSLETQQIADTGLAFGLSLIFGVVPGILVKSVIAGALEPEEEKAVRPVIDFVLPDARNSSYLPLIIKCAWCGKYLGKRNLMRTSR